MQMALSMPPSEFKKCTTAGSASWSTSVHLPLRRRSAPRVAKCRTCARARASAVLTASLPQGPARAPHRDAQAVLARQVAGRVGRAAPLRVVRALEARRAARARAARPHALQRRLGHPEPRHDDGGQQRAHLRVQHAGARAPPIAKFPVRAFARLEVGLVRCGRALGREPRAGTRRHRRVRSRDARRREGGAALPSSARETLSVPSASKETASCVSRGVQARSHRD